MQKPELFDHRPQVKRHKLNRLPENPEKNREKGAVKMGRFPSWLHRKLPQGAGLWETGKSVREKGLATVCEEAKCPNLTECWSKKTATFLVMGHICTRNCGFCDINFSKTPPQLQEDEPNRVAESVVELGLKHVVITMVARDDLFDGGAEHLTLVIEAIRQARPEVTIEVLTSDFQGNEAALDIVLASKPEIFNHNIETVRSLTSRVRHKATYDRTLAVLEYVKKNNKSIWLKSGIMVGLGETKSQVFETLEDLHAIGCDIVTIGQYLQPNQKKLLVKRFVTPEEFKEYESYGLDIGIKQVYAGPFVRSSYNASSILINMYDKLSV